MSEKSPWISVADDRPAETGYVLVACDGGYIGRAFYNANANMNKLKLGRKYHGKWGRYFDLANKGYRVTHWMPELQLLLHPSQYEKSSN